MSEIVASAPGKAVISGEYAVLDGAPAVAAAVTPRARVAIRRADGPNHLVTSAGYTDVRGEFRDHNGRIEWLAGAEIYNIIEPAWQASAAAPRSALAIDIDTGAFFAQGSKQKLGLGSSAALMTALSAALLQLGGANADVAAMAHEAHRQFQHGAGSGVDVACSVRGGLLCYRIVDVEPTALHWPAGLEYAFFWSGVAASTTGRLQALSQRAPRQSRVELDAAATSAAAAWSTGAAAAIVAEMHAYTEVLERFSVDHDLGIFDAGHAGLVTPGGDAVVYKPCGAGGGDIGVALATSGDALTEFTARAAAAGFTRLAIAIDPHGYQVAGEDD